MASQPIKVYCNFHGTYFNTSKRKMEQMAEAEIECICCGRYVNTITSQAFTLPEMQDSQTAPACNCFFAISGGRYTNDYINERHRSKPIRRYALDAEDDEREHRSLFGDF